MQPERLTREGRTALSGESQLLVSSISLWEIALKHQKGRLELGTSPRELVGRLKTIAGLQILDVDLETWLGSLELAWDHSDPADRVVVATASLRDCALLTSDAKMLEFYPRAFF